MCDSLSRSSWTGGFGGTKNPFTFGIPAPRPSGFKPGGCGAGPGSACSCLLLPYLRVASGTLMKGIVGLTLEVDSCWIGCVCVGGGGAEKMGTETGGVRVTDIISG